MSQTLADITIVDLLPTHWPHVARIYGEGIATKNATFETLVPDWETWDKNHRADCRFVALYQNQVTGWAALSNVSNRQAYAGVAEVSIYVDANYRGIGIGESLIATLIMGSEKAGIWTLQSGILAENLGSLKLHQKFGFRTIGHRENVAKMDNVWRNVVLMERRSKIVGLD